MVIEPNRSPNLLPRVSVIVPCRNEARFIARCLESIVANDYPKDMLEILVVDGMSDDQTWNIVGDFAREHPEVKGLRNPRLRTPTALNLGINHARGEIIFRIDAHARVAENYLRLCVGGLHKYEVDNIGGAMETLPADGGSVAKAIAASMSHPFGVGNSDFRVGTEQVVATDTVFGGCYRREVFERIGLFNEHLMRTQDMEFNQRLRKAGGRILLDPKIRCCYYASPDLKSFARHNFDDGLWAILPFAHSEVVPVRLRHLVPGAFTGAIILLLILGIWLEPLLFFLAATMGIYFAASLVSSIHIVWRKRNFRCACLLPVVFGIRHFAYGFGSLCAVMKLACNRQFILDTLGRVKIRPA
ncbi:MAG TPA: glycosyltransferase family 2 protein [Candidatus Acidoferrales bacterium]|nr:glycosyltransferase family 2 protein [Candidatus Acidoferrales bacterium]